MLPWQQEQQRGAAGVCGGQAILADAEGEGKRARSLQACTLHGSGALPASPAGACCNVSAASVDTEHQAAAANARPSLRLSHAW